MHGSFFLRRVAAIAAGLMLTFSAGGALAQGNSGTLNGAVTDATGASIPGATVVILDPVTGYTRSFVSDLGGHFHFYNLPFNPYRLTVTEAGFEPVSVVVQVRSAVPMSLPVTLQVARGAAPAEGAISLPGMRSP